MNKRASGILMPVSSLPGPYGIGCFSKEARAFVDWLADAGQTLWQILPLGPTSYGDSPYQSFSTFAGNPYFIDLETLVQEGLLRAGDCAAADLGSDPADIDYGKLYRNRWPLLRQAFAAWRAAGGPGEAEYRQFLAKNASWLEDYALFMAIKDRQGGAAWDQWPDPLRLRRADALARARSELGEEVAFQQFVQYEFDRQWSRLKEYANSKEIRIIGDIPIYVAFDSADTWARPELFQLDKDGRPTGVAGVPPDGFSATGQLWGNPLYDWKIHRADGYSWWIQRLAACFERYDVVRIDHFRGFDEYFRVPAGAPDARDGQWMPGPGKELFDAVRKALGDRPVIAEDLGYLTDTVRQLVADCGFPGMKVMEFAFDARDSSGANEYLPHNYPENCVVYTGTHDNETVAGWFQTGITDAERAAVCRYLHRAPDAVEPLHLDFVCTAMASVGRWCIIPLQDHLGLDNRARINRPSTLGCNWRWRVEADALTPELAARIRRMSETYGRAKPIPQPEEEEDAAAAPDQAVAGKSDAEKSLR